MDMSLKLDSCLVCGHSVTPVTFNGNRWQSIFCPVCGSYEADYELAEDKLDQYAVPPESRYLVQAWLKRQTLLGSDSPRISDRLCASAIANAPRYTPTEKMQQLLVAYSICCRRPGGIVTLDPDQDYPYAWAEDPGECRQYIQWLYQEKLLGNPESASSPTQEGWALATELQKQLKHSGRTAFVAMWFDDSFDKVWSDGLRPGIQDAGYEPYRMKEDIHSERIDFRLMAAIRSSRFLVAEVSAPRTAVYYEAGFAEGLGKTVIWVCQSDKLKGLSFDTRQFRHIAWKDFSDLRIQLKATIEILLPQ
jgi:hypothetical protein